ncbi:MAG: transcriptional regulator [Solirubrobacterales bacterium]|jgi:AcrR family transcriptional regulator|nr:transcriptional regulator [Solirubrobacterales bacterium]
MARQAASEPKPRRTQAERRAATRSALLDAAIACLVEEGYANLTTRKVAERAGVSQGAQMHYFPTRAQFVAESVRHLATKLAGEIREQIPPDTGGPQRRLEWLLDKIWALHNGPVFMATMELWVAARTDPELRDSLRDVTRDVTRMIAEEGMDLFPDVMSTPGAPALLDTTLAAMRGLAMLAALGNPRDVGRRWRTTRSHLLALYAQLDHMR